ncbi:MAG: competence protein TfoX [Candidatus Midichloriaceae bacterium]|jgi:DNA transformation protein|nr:competence protein TfoX [Candidatus Midichloriaceae bacterium]
MKRKDNKFLEYVKEILEPFGPITTRAMFGGYGIYKNGVIFAIIADNELYFKADDAASKLFQTYGSEPFTYMGKSGLVKMRYWRVMPEVLEDEEELHKWFDMAYAAN